LVGADDEGAAGRFDDVGGDGVQLVDLRDAVDLSEELFGARALLRDSRSMSA
jgi:hypothetical protein